MNAQPLTIEADPSALTAFPYASFDEALAYMPTVEAAVSSYARTVAFDQANRLVQPHTLNANQQSVAELAETIAPLSAFQDLALKHRRLDYAAKIMLAIRERLMAEHLEGSNARASESYVPAGGVS